jgi:hypothetical protein
VPRDMSNIGVPGRSIPVAADRPALRAVVGSCGGGC